MHKVLRRVIQQMLCLAPQRQRKNRIKSSTLRTRIVLVTSLEVLHLQGLRVKRVEGVAGYWVPKLVYNLLEAVALHIRLR